MVLLTYPLVDRRCRTIFLRTCPKVKADDQLHGDDA